MADNTEDLPVTLRPFVPFRQWWKVDDKAWVEQRKAEWKRLKKNWPFKEYDAIQIKALARFYVFGEEIPESEQYKINSAFISEMDRFLLTPYGSPEDARRLFEAFSHSTNRASLLNTFAGDACIALAGMSYMQQKVADFVEGVLGDEYRIIEADVGSPSLNRKEIISPPAGFFTECYISAAIDFLSRESLRNYIYVVYAASYFISALRYMEMHGEEVDPMIEQLVKLVMSSDDATLNDLQRELVERLRAAFEAEDAPACVKRYVKSKGPA